MKMPGLIIDGNNDSIQTLFERFMTMSFYAPGRCSKKLTEQSLKY